MNNVADTYRPFDWTLGVPNKNKFLPVFVCNVFYTLLLRFLKNPNLLAQFMNLLICHFDFRVYSLQYQPCIKSLVNAIYYSFVWFFCGI